MSISWRSDGDKGATSGPQPPPPPTAAMSSSSQEWGSDAQEACGHGPASLSVGGHLVVV